MTINEAIIIGIKQIAPLAFQAVLVGIGAIIISAIIYGIFFLLLIKEKEMHK